MNELIKKVVILGGGTAGWMSAALLKKIIGSAIDIELVESDAIGPIGVGEATIPPIKIVNSVLGINESDFLKKTKGSIKLAIKFENWRVQGESYFHTFGVPGKSMAFCHFHHLVHRAQAMGHKLNIWDYDLNYLCAKEGKFAQINAKDPILDLPYAYHFDASLYAAYLRDLSEMMGVKRTEGLVKTVQQHTQTGFIKSLELEDGQRIDGDLFIDCSGFKALLIQEQLGTGFDDWSHFLPCDSAIAVPSERLEHTLPYTRSIAHASGWQWRIPLQHRNGNGLVYSSSYCSDDEAHHTLMANLDTKPLADPKVIRFRTGRRRKQWDRNVIAVGLSSGFLEPLESTSIHLIQSAIVRLARMFPHHGVNHSQIAEYNKQSKLEFEQIRDFLILHYHVNERVDSRFWRDMRNLPVPDSLTQKIELFRQNGQLFREQDDLFLETSWLQVMLGQGINPKDHHPIAGSFSEEKLFGTLASIKRIKDEPIAQLPSHDDFLKKFCRL
ncbi:tryptophan halogenase family protein [Alteromonas sp. ASW11-130]|uniref:tryptophan halogenase family protein n=1 Tax=Alteromonas sp. ASW11-130 TaxID=3015775 RepID=UPI002241D5DA|nr:tryptophan halogenase family protein [Alteromonas sp. ASW11-130]MCW8090952.1 tryptophan 7-halogenase [Alteromonas sp. ASW11-130]